MSIHVTASDYSPARAPRRTLLSLLAATACLCNARAGAQAPPVEVAKLTASDVGPGDGFGHRVAIDGDTAVIAAPFHHSGEGAVYVFRHTADQWLQAAKLTASDHASTDNFGFGVAISCHRIVVGAPNDDNGAGTDAGAAYVFDEPAGGWANMTESAKLTASDGVAFDYVGESVATDGRTVVVSSQDDDLGTDSGAALVFVFERCGWTEAAKLTASDGAAGDRFGLGLSVDVGVIAVGAPHPSGPGAGSAYVFEEPAGGWADMTETAKLTASDGATGDIFGHGVSMYDGTVLVEASRDDDSGTDSGSAYVFEAPPSGWGSAPWPLHETAKLTASDGAAGDEFGLGVSVLADVAMVGAPHDDDDGASSGSVYAFTRAPGGWSTTTETHKLTASDATSGAMFGFRVALSGTWALVGAPGANSAYVFELLEVCPGDINRDGAVDVQDLVWVISNWGTCK